MIRLLLKNFLLIFLSAIICGAAAFSYCKFFADEKYAANGSVLVTNGGIVDSSILNGNNIAGQTVNNSDIAASLNLLTTIRDILSTNDIYIQLSEKLGGKYTYHQLKSFATISKSDDYSLFIKVRFQTGDPEEVVMITNAFLQLVPDYITKFIPSSASTVTYADGSAKTAPRTVYSTLLATIAGAVIAYAIFYIISLTNTTIQCEEDFKQRFDVPVLGDIPDFMNAKSDKYGKSSYKGGSYYGN